MRGWMAGDSGTGVRNWRRVGARGKVASARVCDNERGRRRDVI